MNEIPRPKLNKIPGMPSKKESYKQDLSKLTNLELTDMKNREELLLKNKKRLEKLPDKGQRIQEFYEKIKAELQRRSSIDAAAEMFSKLNIASAGKNALNEMEWSKRFDFDNDVDPVDDVLDSDDEPEVDPLKIVAQGAMHERKVRILPEEPTLITQEDLEDIQSLTQSKSDLVDGNESTDTASEGEIDAELITVDVSAIRDKLKNSLKSINIKESMKSESKKDDPKANLDELEKHALYVVEKTETLAHAPLREKFKPYRTTISNVHDPEKERARKQGKHWEITAATPPPIQHKGTQMLSLLDSVHLQTEYLEKMKELQEKQAEERLAARIQRLTARNIELPTDIELIAKPAFTQYRTRMPNIEGERDLNGVNEVEDIDDEGAGLGIVYTVYE